MSPIMLQREFSKIGTILFFIPFYLSLLSILYFLIPATASSSAIVILNNHRLYDRGADILLLQKFLNDHNFIVSKSGPGSPGNETSMFGALTYRALVKFQSSQGLPATGFLGPLTRARIASFSATLNNLNNAPILNNSVATTTSIIYPTFPQFQGLGNGYTPGFGGGGSPVTVSPTPAPDTTAPAISSIATSSATSNSILVTWNTDESSDSRIDYGTTSSYGSATSSSSMTTSHSLTITGLSVNTTYHFRIQSEDSSGNISNSSDQTLQIISAPTIVSQAFTATDGAGTEFNTSTISVDVTGSDTMLVSCWHAEFGSGLDNLGAFYGWEFRYNGIWGRQFFDTDGYHGGDGNRLLRCAYWVAPTAGTHDLVVTLTDGTFGGIAGGANELTVTAVLLNNVAQTFYPFRDTQKDISASVRTSETETVTSSIGDLVMHVMASALTTAGTLGAGETSVLKADDGTDDASLLISTKAGASSVTVSSSGWASSFPLQGLAMSIMPADTAEDHVVFTDDFNRADESPLSKSGTWTAPAGAAINPVSLVSNKAKGSTANENIAIVSTPTFPDDQWAQISYQSGTYTRAWVRVTDSGGYMLTTNSASTIRVYKVANNGTTLTYTQLGSDIGIIRNLVAGDLMGLEVVGTTLNVYFNGQFIESRTDSTYTSGQPGLGSFGAENISGEFQASSLPIRN